MMNRKTLLVGISVAAMAAGAAQAQSNNQVSVTCSPANACPATPFTYAVGSDDNRVSIVAQGTGNSVTNPPQVGDDNVSIIDIIGNNNVASHGQTGDDHYAESRVRGNANGTNINQATERNSATVNLNGSGNSSTVNQGVGAAVGRDNRATVTASGNDSESSITQGTDGVGAATSGDNNVATVNLVGGDTGGSGAAGTPNLRYSTIVQGGRGDTAIVDVRGGATATAGNAATYNSSSITQRNTFFDVSASGVITPRAGANVVSTSTSGNRADVSVTGAGGNASTIAQNGVQNSATVSMLGGGTGITSGAAGGVTTGSGPGSLDTPNARREGNNSLIQQTGRNNVAAVSAGGIGGVGRGNQSTIRQGDVGTSTTARGHQALVWQQGTLDSVTIDQVDNTGTIGGGGGAPTTGAQFGSFADVSQRSFASTIGLTQNGQNRAVISQGGGAADIGATQSGNNSIVVTQTDAGDFAGSPGDVFGGGGSTTPAQNVLAVSQAGQRNSLNVAQDAIGATADVFQRRGSNRNTVNLEQGGLTLAGGLFPGATGGNGAGGNATRNVQASIEQGGNGTTTAGTDSNIDVRQAGVNLSVQVRQNSENFSTRQGAAAAVLQTGANNTASLVQAGSFASATIEQRGSGSAALRNSVRIEQTGGGLGTVSTGNNFASALQTAAITGASAAGSAAAGPAGDPDARAAGSRSAEIVILQTNTSTATASGAGDNSAFVEQRAAGAYARIVQNGRNNLAGILQDTGAVNSVAIIEQTGNDNVFGITQNAAGQFFRVRQDGTGNNVITGSGAGNGGTGATVPGSVPTFAPVAP